MVPTLRSIIPPGRIAAVEEALLYAFNTIGISAISLLTGGLSGSSVYKIIVNDESYVLKLDSTNSDLSGSYARMEMAASAGIAPPVYYLHTKEGLSITKFIENKPLRAVFSTPEVLLGELARTIRTIHKMPLISTENSLLKIVKSLITQAEESPLFVKTIFGDFFDYFDIILTRYPWNDKDKVTSHNDLNPNNLICDGNRLWVVDWDAAFLNDRYADLAITANFYVSNGQEEQLLLGAYFGDGLSPYHSARFFVMRQICRFIYAVHMVNLGNATDADNIIHEPEFKTITMQQFGEQMREGKLSIASSRGQLYFGKASINEALRDMRSPRFEASMKLFS